MKKACSLVVSALLIAALALSASAASPESDGAAAILPVDVVVDQETTEIRKVYSLPPSVDPEALPREGFDRDGYHYECSDILCEVVMGEDGFEGTLYLNLNTLRTEVTGYGSSSKTVKATRTYPNLSSADATHLPKTISDGGRTMTLQDVE